MGSGDDGGGVRGNLLEKARKREGRCFNSREEKVAQDLEKFSKTRKCEWSAGGITLVLCVLRVYVWGGNPAAYDRVHRLEERCWG